MGVGKRGSQRESCWWRRAFCAQVLGACCHQLCNRDYQTPSCDEVPVYQCLEAKFNDPLGRGELTDQQVRVHDVRRGAMIESGHSRAVVGTRETELQGAVGSRGGRVACAQMLHADDGTGSPGSRLQENWQETTQTGMYALAYNYTERFSLLVNLVWSSFDKPDILLQVRASRINNSSCSSCPLRMGMSGMHVCN